MGNKYFIHEIRIGIETFKGIVICDNFDAAKQGYHAFLGAYAYGNHDGTDFCQSMITDMSGNIFFPETWLREKDEENKKNKEEK